MTAPSWSTLARASGRARARYAAAAEDYDVVVGAVMRGVRTNTIDPLDMPGAIGLVDRATARRDTAQAARNTAHADAVRAYNAANYTERALVWR